VGDSVIRFVKNLGLCHGLSLPVSVHAFLFVCACVVVCVCVCVGGTRNDNIWRCCLVIWLRYHTSFCDRAVE
jgi:hypothetical protein